MVVIRSGSTKSCACLSVLSVLLLLGSFCPVLVGLPSSIHLTTYNIAELGKQNWPFVDLYFSWYEEWGGPYSCKSS